ncbi:MAG: hypothetical protein ACK5WL_23615 [Pseudanabaena sp.]|jgi:hypothetical protein
MSTIDAINQLALDKVELRDRPYLLYTDTLSKTALNQLVFRYTAERVSYREDLIKRHTSTSKSGYLNLQLHSNRELDAIKQICQNATKPIVLLEDLDILLAYLATRPNSPLQLFWRNLAATRQLACPIWILLPKTWATEMSGKEGLWDIRVKFL